MKKTLLSLVAVAAFGIAAHAQFSIIPKGGVSLANVAFSEEDNEQEGQKMNMGFVAGVGFNLPLDEDGFFSIQPELLYIQKGAAAEYSESGTEDGFDYSVTYKEKQVINYLEIPLLAKVSFGTDAIKAYVNIGPSFGFGLNGKAKEEITQATIDGEDVLNQIPDEDKESDIKLKFGDGDSDDETAYLPSDSFNRLDLGVQFGGGIGLQAGPGALLLDFRYGLGLSNFYKGDEDLDIDADGKNRVIAVTLGYAIPLGN